MSNGLMIMYYEMFHVTCDTNSITNNLLIYFFKVVKKTCYSSEDPEEIKTRFPKVDSSDATFEFRFN